MAAGLQVIALCLISGLWIAEHVECAPQKDHLSIFCPHGWTRYNSRCFQYQPVPKAWADAERHCTSLGGNLASIRSSGEYHFIRKVVFIVAKHHKQSWVGGYNAAKLHHTRTPRGLIPLFHHFLGKLAGIKKHFVAKAKYFWKKKVPVTSLTKVWLWSDGSPFKFNHWGKGEPNNAGGSEGCMEINLRGGDHVNDQQCNRRQPFICAKNL